MAAHRKKDQKNPKKPKTEIRCQKGPQETFLSCPADIAIYGGAAGGGKTWAALIEPLRHLVNPEFEAVIFRRSRPQIKQAGGLLVESEKIYPLFGAQCNYTDLVWTFPSGMRVRMAQLQHEKSKLEWQGAQIALAIFDELCHFTEGQFFYILSRMRSTCGVRPYVRGTCNPDADSWVADFISWWIDQDTGLPIPERSGVVRYFVRDGDTILWGDSHEELREQVPHWADAQFKPKSVTFIAATVFDNKALLAKDPEYLSNLMALPLVEREQLLGGNWKIRPAAGLYFKERWFKYIEPHEVPSDCEIVTWWDLAATEDRKPKKKTDEDTGPAYTARVKLAKSKSLGKYYVLDVIRERMSELEVENAIANTASKDGRKVKIGLPQDPGQAGKFQSRHLIRKLAGYDVHAIAEREMGDKLTRAKSPSAQAEAGNIEIVRGDWNKDFMGELVNFPDGKFKDQVDGLSGAFFLHDGAPSRKFRSR